MVYEDISRDHIHKTFITEYQNFLYFLNLLHLLSKLNFVIGVSVQEKKVSVKVSYCLWF